MAYTQTITNDQGELLGTETHYDDEPGYYDDDYDYGPEDYDDGIDPDLGMDDVPEEAFSGTEYVDDEDYPGTRQTAPRDFFDLCAVNADDAFAWDLGPQGL